MPIKIKCSARISEEAEVPAHWACNDYFAVFIEPQLTLRLTGRIDLDPPLAHTETSRI
jgi:hypothetical protein